MFCGIEQVTLAERSGVSRQAISACESGAVFPRRPVLKRLDDALVSIMVERLVAGATEAAPLRERLVRLETLELAVREQMADRDRLRAEVERLRAAQRPPSGQARQGAGEPVA